MVMAATAALMACSKQAHHDSHANAPSMAASALPGESEIAGLFDLWNETLQNGTPHDMAMLYAEDGVLLPTVSNEARSNRPEITEYFVHFQEKQPRGTINEQYIDVLDENTAVNSGIYTFDLVKDGAPAFVVARYSYLYEKINGKWLIKSHHSSAMPEPVEGRPAPLADRRVARVTVRAVSKPGAHGEGHESASAGHGDGHGANAAHAPKAAHGEAHAPAKAGAAHH
jgi:uncharacterized protein (TIGR02246 family)